MTGSSVTLPPSWDAHRRLLARSGRAAWLTDSAGRVAWGNAEAWRCLPGLSAEGADLCALVPGFTPGAEVQTAHGRLLCEAVEQGWAVFLEPLSHTFLASHVLDLIPIPVFWKDRAGIYRGCNRAFADLLGCRIDDLVGKDVFALSPPELAGKYQAMDEELMAGGTEAIQCYEWDVRASTGATRRVMFHKANLTEGGAVVGLVGTVQDVTDLRGAERKFTTVFATCPDAIAISDKQTGRYLDVNPAFEEALGYRRDEAVGRTSVELDIWAEPDARARMLEAFAAQGRLTNYETRFRRKGGEVFTALISVEVTELDGTDCLIMAGRDISARKHEEMVLRRTADELHRSNLELERFAYVAAHDLQEPCRTICSFAQLLERRHGEALGQEGREYLSYLSNGAQRMRELIQGLLSYSRVNSNRMRFEPVALGDLMRSVLGDLAGAVGQSGAAICVGDLPRVRGDAVQLQQVLVNLVGNALKFQPPGQQPRIDVEACRLGDQWQITVRDNGIGIDPQYADEIFGMFRRLHGGGIYPGTGIGLALVRRVVEAHGGRVWVESKPGEGSAFHFTLPA